MLRSTDSHVFQVGFFGGRASKEAETKTVPLNLYKSIEMIFKMSD